jgi:hypothetical protein
MKYVQSECSGPAALPGLYETLHQDIGAWALLSSRPRILFSQAPTRRRHHRSGRAHHKRLRGLDQPLPKLCTCSEGFSCSCASQTLCFQWARSQSQLVETEGTTFRQCWPSQVEVAPRRTGSLADFDCTHLQRVTDGPFLISPAQRNCTFPLSRNIRKVVNIRKAFAHKCGA